MHLDSQCSAFSPNPNFFVSPPSFLYCTHFPWGGRAARRISINNPFIFPLFCPDLGVPGFKEQFLIPLVFTLAESLAMKVRCQPLGQLINVHGLSPVECKFVTKYTLARCVWGAMAVEGHYLSNKTYRTAGKEDSRSPMLTQPENCFALATVIRKGHLQV